MYELKTKSQKEFGKNLSKAKAVLWISMFEMKLTIENSIQELPTH